VVFGMQRASARARLWPTAPGRIESSSVQSYKLRSRSTNETSPSWKDRYKPNIVYGYDVDGVHYRGDKIS
jgi:hypothetical protein